MDIMVLRAPGLNSLIGLLLILLSCNSKEKKNAQYINAEGKKVQFIAGITYVDGAPAVGILYSLYPNSTDTAIIISYVKGKEHGVYKTFYPKGKLRDLRYFVNGWKEGTHKGWYPSGRLAYVYHFNKDEFNGPYKEWTAEGVLFRDMNYEHGYENGSQKIYYSNGKIKSNYVLKNGIRYGLLGTKNCVSVSDSIPVNP